MFLPCSASYVISYCIFFFILSLQAAVLMFFNLSSPEDIQESPPPVPKLET